MVAPGYQKMLNIGRNFLEYGTPENKKCGSKKDIEHIENGWRNLLLIFDLSIIILNLRVLVFLAADHLFFVVEYLMVDLVLLNNVWSYLKHLLYMSGGRSLFYFDLCKHQLWLIFIATSFSFFLGL